MEINFLILRMKRAFPVFDSMECLNLIQSLRNHTWILLWTIPCPLISFMVWVVVTEVGWAEKLSFTTACLDIIGGNKMTGILMHSPMKMALMLSRTWSPDCIILQSFLRMKTFRILHCVLIQIQPSFLKHFMCQDLIPLHWKLIIAEMEEVA